MREIERQTGVAKSTIRETLQQRGLTLRNFSQRQSKPKKRPTGMRCGVIPYGFAYLEGELVVDPREYKIVLSMVKLWQSGKSFKAIVDDLNAKKIPSRLGKRWFGPTVAAIVRREVERQSATKRLEKLCQN